MLLQKGKLKPYYFHSLDSEAHRSIVVMRFTIVQHIL